MERKGRESKNKRKNISNNPKQNTLSNRPQKWNPSFSNNDNTSSDHKLPYNYCQTGINAWKHNLN